MTFWESKKKEVVHTTVETVCEPLVLTAQEAARQSEENILKDIRSLKQKTMERIAVAVRCGQTETSAEYIANNRKKEEIVKYFTDLGYTVTEPGHQFVYLLGLKISW